MTKTVFMTGGTGRIGKHILQQLLALGYKVKVLVHNAEPEDVSSDNLEIVRGDILDRNTFADALEGCQFVCHLAAVFDMGAAIETDSENDYLFDHLIRGTSNVLEAARAVGTVELFEFASSDAVYCVIYKQTDALITEEVELSPRPGRYYAMAKATLESMCINYQKTYGLPYAVLRVGWCLDDDDVLDAFQPGFWDSMYAPGEHDRLGGIHRDADYLIAPQYENGESVAVQLAHSSDIASGFVLAIERQQQAINQIINLSSDAPFKFHDYIEKVARGLNKPWEAVTLSGLGTYQISIDKARRLLGYEPIYDIDRMIDVALAKRGA